MCRLDLVHLDSETIAKGVTLRQTTGHSDNAYSIRTCMLYADGRTHLSSFSSKHWISRDPFFRHNCSTNDAWHFGVSDRG